MAYDKRKMQDISFSEKQLWQQYIAAWNGNDPITDITELINDNLNLKYKVLNAYNWNRLINLVNDQTSTTAATYDSLVGKWQTDYARLETASEDFIYRGEWNSSIAYKRNNLVTVGDYNAYFCIQDNTGQPTTNASYWLLALTMLPPIGIQVTTTEPSGLRTGDVWIQEISTQ